jgi:nitrite reductase/ring-hydroxylating ferredoxin subunit
MRHGLGSGAHLWQHSRSSTRIQRNHIGAGFAADEAVRHPRQPQPLVAGRGHWYDVAAADEVATGQMKAFAAGGILSYLVNNGHRLQAISAIRTHMGCRLKPRQDPQGLRCLSTVRDSVRSAQYSLALQRNHCRS